MLVGKAIRPGGHLGRVDVGLHVVTLARTKSGASHTAHRRGRWHDRFMPCRVLLVDDDSDFRRAARQLLERHEFAVVAEAETGISGIERAQEHRPDLVLVDVKLPDIDGFEVAERLSRLEVPVHVILTSSLADSDFGALVAGSSALGFVPKAELSASAIEALLAPAR